MSDAESRKRIVLDVDGVLVDFVSAALRLFRRGTLYHDWPPGEYDICSVLKIEPADFWARVEQQGAAWWARLPWYTWAEQMYRALDRVAPVTLVTTASQDPESFSGKARFCQLFLSRICGGNSRAQRGFAITAESKAVFAGPGRLLVDDSDHQVDAWRHAGGPAVLFPQLWNSQYRRAWISPAQVAEEALAAFDNTLRRFDPTQRRQDAKEE